TGVSIAFVYAVTVSLFFVGVIAFLGTKLMHMDPSMTTQPMSRIVLGAFAGLFIGALIFGLFYSAVISFLLAKRLSQYRTASGSERKAHATFGCELLLRRDDQDCAVLLLAVL